MKTGGNFHADLAKDLKNPNLKALFEAERHRLDLKNKIQKAMKTSRLSVRKMAERMGTSKSQVERLLKDETANIGIKTLVKFAAIVGKRLEIRFK